MITYIQEEQDASDHHDQTSHTKQHHLPGLPGWSVHRFKLTKLTGIAAEQIGTGGALWAGIREALIYVILTVFAMCSINTGARIGIKA